MKVAVTGGTGYVGCHTVAALQRAGHEVRLLVRSPDQVERSLRPVGADPDAVEVVVADVTDTDAVRKGLEGCDAVIHAASVFTYDPRRADEIAAVNQRGIDNVLGTAIDLGLDPIVHVSSVAALMRDGVSDVEVDEDSPVGDAPVPYTASKIRQEQHVRDLQEQGHPIVITYPGGVWGPGDPYNSEATQGVKACLKGLWLFSPPVAFATVDVRDVAAVHAAVLEPGRGPRRYMIGGHHATVRDLMWHITGAVGKPKKPLPAPTWFALLLGRFADWLRTRTGFNLGVNYESVWSGARRLHPDNSRIAEEFGIHLRPLDQTVGDHVRWLQQQGRI